MAGTSGQPGLPSMVPLTSTVSLFLAPSPPERGQSEWITHSPESTRVREVRRNLLQLSHLPSLPSHHGVADSDILERDLRWLPCSQRSGDGVHDLDRDQRSRRQRALDGQRFAWRLHRPRQTMRHRRLETPLRERRAQLYHAKRM